MNMNDYVSGHHHEDDNHVAENGQRDVDAMAAMAVSATCTWRRNRRRDPVPMHNSSLTGRMRVGDPLHKDYARDCMPVSGNVDVNADYVFDDIASGTGPSTGPQQHDTRMDAMNRVREMMADDMWDIFQSAPWYKTM
ncbi:hypothetical protein TIFTF001_025001 [Ficus carica]|uniref:Uncharacterized protein n=1 Tax=Ficus carica TaxID=3494 RepID=A0AA88AM84_FICCA|nr:hypothetical protein TIFTF001_025001 [Ficus carica]